MLRISFASHQIILRNNLNMSDFCETCVPCTEWEAVEESHQHMPCPLTVASKRPRTPSEDNHRWWNVDLQVWPSTATQVRSNIKACLLFLFTFMELCTYECVSQGQTVNHHYYTDTLLHLWESVKWKWHDYMDLQNTGSYTMTTHLLIMLCLCIKLWLKNYCYSTLSLLTMLYVCFSFLKTHYHIKEKI